MGAAIAAFMLLFAIVIGRYAFKMPWKMILADLDLVHGGFIPLGLLELAFGPFVAMHPRNYV